MTGKWFVLHINPEPWAVGSISGKRISPNPNLVAFQSAVREELEGQTLPRDFRKLEFFFFRQTAKYIDTSDHVRQRNQADTTNCQKALEDALQGVLFHNDREIVDIRSVMVMQSHRTKPAIVIHATQTNMVAVGAHDIPSEYLEQALSGPDQAGPKSDRWLDAEDDF